MTATVTMSNTELNQLFCLNREVRDMEYRIREIKAKATSVTANLTGMPGSDSKGTRGNMETYMAVYADLTDALYDRLEILNEKRLQLLEFLDNVQESQVREAMMARYFDGLTWTQVARKMGGNATPESVRKMCTRYISANCSDDNEAC